MARDLARREGGRSGLDRLEPFELMRDMFRWDPFRDLERTFRGVVGGEGFTPSFDVKETSDAYVIRADLPGMSEDDVDVSLSGNLLTISGERTQEERKEDETWYTLERRHGSFTRSFTLPEDVDAEHCEASFENGVLTVRLGKHEEDRPKRIKLFGKGKHGSEGAKGSEAKKAGNGKRGEARA